MLGASWVDEHSIVELAAEHNQLLNALLLAADRSKVGLLCGLQQLRPARRSGRRYLLCYPVDALWHAGRPEQQESEEGECAGRAPAIASLGLAPAPAQPLPPPFFRSRLALLR